MENGNEASVMSMGWCFFTHGHTRIREAEGLYR